MNVQGGGIVVRPLVVTEDSDVLDAVVKLAATRATEVLVVVDSDSIYRSWQSAPLVIIGMDQLARIAQMKLQRRSRIVVVSVAEADAVSERRAWQHAVAVGVEHVVELPEGEQWLLDAFDDSGGSVGQIITVVGGSGGAGASTCAVNLAVTARGSGRTVALVDLDPWSGGLDLLMGAERAPGLRWSALQGVNGRISSRALADSCVNVAGVHLVSCDSSDVCTEPAIHAVVDALQRGYQHVVVDLPSPTAPSARDVIGRSHRVLLVVRAHIHAAASASRVAQWIRACGHTPDLVVVNAVKGLLPREIADALELPLVASLPFVPSMSSRSDAGELPSLPSAYRKECESALGIHEAQAA